MRLVFSEDLASCTFVVRTVFMWIWEGLKLSRRMMPFISLIGLNTNPYTGIVCIKGAVGRLCFKRTVRLVL